MMCMLLMRGRCVYRLANPAVSMECASKRGCRTIQPCGNRRRSDSPLQLRVDHGSLFNTQLPVGFSHATVSPVNVALGI